MFEAICGYYGVEIGTYPVINNDKEIYVYDNSLTGKQYIMYLAELFGGNAKIERDGSCSIYSIKNYTGIEINALDSKKFEIGDTYELTRMCYDDGIVKLQAGGNVIDVDELPEEDIDTSSFYYLIPEMKYYKYVSDEWIIATEIKNTLYLRPDNLFISQQLDVEKIFRELEGFSITNITCENRMDLSLDSWDIVTYTVGQNSYNTFYDNIITYNGVTMGKVEVNIPLQTQEETTNVINNTTDAKIYRIKKIVNEQENTITQTISEVNETVQKTNETLETVEGLTETITNLSDGIEDRFTQINNSIEGIQTELSTIGGNNIFLYAKEFWTDGTTNPNNEANLDEQADTVKQYSISGMGYIINNGTSEQKIAVKNDTYTISFKYKKLINLATVYVEINGTRYDLNSTTWTEFVETIDIDTDTIDFKIVSDTNNALEMYDLMGNIGNEKQLWTQNPNETRTETVTIGKGIQVDSSTTNTYTRIDADGNRIYNRNTGNIVTDMTDKGINTENINANGGQIGGILIQEIDNQTWISSLL